MSSAARTAGWSVKLPSGIDGRSGAEGWISGRVPSGARPFACSEAGDEHPDQQRGEQGQHGIVHQSAPQAVLISSMRTAHFL